MEGREGKEAHLAGVWARGGARVTLIDADPQGSALDWADQRAREGAPRLFGVLGLPRDTLHHEAPEIARSADYVVIDGPPRVAGLMRSALLAADLVIIPVQPSPFDGWASAELLNRVLRRTVIAQDTANSLADHDPPLLASWIGQRIAFADAARTGRLVCDDAPTGDAARDIARLAAEIGALKL
ncbi:MAG: cobyrinic acid a,c-diamide synthase [Acidiphilium sp. 37-64-53]|uniref:AAA family ATPase n=1 Tax=Acidiphilium sp. 37-64-53 TaxID=1970299 RepID=UPI000BC9A0EE|nr:AAA family ATPase [Acidiphilium sp. 37-64-53]OYV98974.1 MAG: cobyrinic acid a,c-diamide synthase [Acidiphilium sp. 37-64-53]